MQLLDSTWFNQFVNQSVNQFFNQFTGKVQGVQGSTAIEEVCTIVLQQSFSKDASGTIDKSELATIMYKISSSMSEREIDKLLAVIDKNQDGLIDFKARSGY